MRSHDGSAACARFSWVLAPSVALMLGAAAGCVDGPALDAEVDGPEAAVASIDGKADGAAPSELRVRTGQLTVWLDVRARADVHGAYGPRVVIAGRASRDLESAMSWVPDDAFGEVTIKSKRTFEIVLDEGHEINTVLSGSPLYLTLRSKTGTPRDYYLRIVLEPRLTNFSGSKDVWLRDALLPVYVRDGRWNLQYRALATTTSAAASFTVATSDDNDPTVRMAGALRYEADWGYGGVIGVMTPARDRVTFSASWGGSAPRTATKQASVVATVAKVAIATEDPYVSLVVSPVCDDSVRRCIGLQNGDDNLGLCGTYRDVAVCLWNGPICGDQSPALALREVDAPELQSNLTLFNEAQARAGAAGNFADVIDYRLPVCLLAAPDLATVVGLARELEGGAFDGGRVITREELLATRMFGDANAGAGLLGVLDGWQGSTKASYWYSEQVAGGAGSALVVAYYAETGRVFTLHGSF